jgi:hypothetical protein
MYLIVLILHSWLRWAAIIAGLLAVVTLLTSQPRPGVADPSDRWGRFFIIALDLQFLLGMLLYIGLSPTTYAIFHDTGFGAAMKDPVARFWAVEHVTLMLVAIVVAHLGRVLARKAATPAAKRTRLLVCFGIALLAIFARTPWPGTTAGRPLFRVSSAAVSGAVWS